MRADHSMTKDTVTELLTQRAAIMNWLDACPESEDEVVAGALVELDQRIALQRTTSPIGKALAAAFLEHELNHLLDGAPAVQRNVVLAYLAMLREGLPDIPADVAKVLERQ
jgi:hypothetical protein